MDEISANNVIIQRMIRDGLAFSREVYIDIFYEGQVPKPWTEKHEALLPPVFRLALDDQRQALKNLSEAIGLAYNGEVPS
jgi:hypothetical protein